MKFKADFHIHSHFSRATAKNLNIENLYIAAQLKGLSVIATGDITHPQWLQEIQEKLVEAEPGLFKLKENTAKICDSKVPDSCKGQVRFMLVSEISNIYKKNGKTRKNHNLVFLPDLVSVEKFNTKLDKIGNIKSDGRPILGLDARNLLEIALETSEKAFCIPAHIWTPWFSMLGSKSGFDSLKECFGDLSDHIFAAETGLSSDPPMNWRVSCLDNITLVSNSDAHSPMKLGREANIFNTQLSFDAIKQAIKTGDPQKFLGTIEYFPQEGKYHLDGHRKCKIRFTPKQTFQAKGICPVCKKPLTLGVLYRVEELADKTLEEKPEKRHPFYSIIPLDDLLSEILQVGPSSKKVKNQYEKIIETFGNELSILNDISIQSIEKAGEPLLSEAIKRMRSGNVYIYPGYDGEFGKIKIFEEGEREAIIGQKSLFSLPSRKKSLKKIETGTFDLNQSKKGETLSKPEKFELNQDQLKAVELINRPLLIIAGPGTGKTFTLTKRIARLIQNRIADSESILAVTFTNKAAREMKERLKKDLGDNTALPFIGTFHSLCLKIIESRGDRCFIVDEKESEAIMRDAVKSVYNAGYQAPLNFSDIRDFIVKAKQNLLGPDSDFKEEKADLKALKEIYRTYQDFLDILKRLDYEDLIFKVVKLFETEPEFCKKFSFKHIFVDEYQDLNYGQYKIVKALARGQICVIGDPNQSIYGFRGSDASYFKSFTKDFPDAKIIKLTKNYRSTETILKASARIINEKERVYSGIEGIEVITILENLSAKAEAVAIGKIIEKMIGGLGFHSIDFGAVNSNSQDMSFSDFAILYRTNDQSKVFSKIFSKVGIPYQIAGKESILSHKEWADLISLLKLTENVGSFSDLERVSSLFTSGIGKKSLSKFKIWAYKKRFSFEKAVENALKHPIPGISVPTQRGIKLLLDNISALAKKTDSLSAEEKIESLVENTTVKFDQDSLWLYENLKMKALRFRSDIKGFLKTIILQTDTDTYEPGIEKVTLMSMHSAKGLEFPVVFIVGCEDGYIPFKKNGKTDIDEERRLFYVAMTRAKQRLYLSYSKKRVIYGKTELRNMSVFVKDIEKKLLQKSSSALKETKKHVQMNIFGKI